MMIETLIESGGMQSGLNDVQEARSKPDIPWYSEFARIEYDYNDETIYSSAITESAEMLGCSSFMLPVVDKDVVEYENVLSAGVATEGVNTSISFGTRSVDVNKLNQDDLEFFRMHSDEVVRAITTTDFEDGMDNDVTELVRSFKRRNKLATYNWLNELYGKNLREPLFVEGLLRVLAVVTKKGEETGLMPIVVAGLRSGNSAEQEAAIMVIEEWRTKECLDALVTSSLTSGWVRKYAEKVEKELAKEVG